MICLKNGLFLRAISILKMTHHKMHFSIEGNPCVKMCNVLRENCKRNFFFTKSVTPNDSKYCDFNNIFLFFRLPWTICLCSHNTKIDLVYLLKSKLNYLLFLQFQTTSLNVVFLMWWLFKKFTAEWVIFRYFYYVSHIQGYPQRMRLSRRHETLNPNSKVKLNLLPWIQSLNS